MRLDIRQSQTGPAVIPSIKLDGKDIGSALFGLNLAMGAGDRTQVELDLAIDEIEAHGEGVEAYIHPSAHDLLVQLGWRPPEQDE